MNSSGLGKRSKHEDGVDLISNMLDALLLSILSHLSSTEEVIRSSILSRRRRNLWTVIPSLDMRCGENFKKSEFKEFVYWVLGNKAVDLDSFRLCCYDYYSMSTVWRWIHMAVTRNVKQLDLSFGPKELYKNLTEVIELPHSLVSCGSLEVLKLNLSKNGLSLRKVMGFPVLRVLDLTHVDLLEDDDLVKDFLESCPLLEELSLIDCVLNKLDLLWISCPKLKRLSIDNWYEESCDVIKISCPKLAFLHLEGDIGCNLVFDQRLDSLKEALIVPRETDPYTEPVLYRGNSHARPLWMHIYFFCECIKAARDLVLPNLKTLVLHVTIATFTFNELIQLLNYCPKLESLKLIIAEYFEDMVDEAEPTWISTPDVKSVEFFEINGEKPKLVISNDCNCKQIVATWGNTQDMYSPWKL